MQGKAPSVTKTPETPQFPSWNQYLNELGSFASSMVPQPGSAPVLGTPYGGELTAPMNQMQMGAYSQLGNYLQQPNYTQGSQYQQANQQLMDTVSGKYLGQQSPYELAVNNQLMTQQLPQLQNMLQQRTAMTGTGSSGYAGQMQEKLMNDVMSQLAVNRGAQYNIERQNQLQAINPSMAAAQQQQYAPMQQADMALGYGNQLQGQQQTIDTNLYNEFNRQRQEQLGALSPSGTASNLGSAYQQYDYSLTPGKQSAFSSYIAPAIQLAGLAGAPFTGGASIPISNMLAQGGNMFANNYGSTTSPFANFSSAFSNLAGGMGYGSGGTNSLTSFLGQMFPNSQIGSGAYSGMTGIMDNGGTLTI